RYPVQYAAGPVSCPDVPPAVAGNSNNITKSTARELLNEEPGTIELQNSGGHARHVTPEQPDVHVVFRVHVDPGGAVEVLRKLADFAIWRNPENCVVPIRCEEQIAPGVEVAPVGSSKTACKHGVRPVSRDLYNVFCGVSAGDVELPS